MKSENHPSEINREIIFLAGLLHDIGKFYQRADRNFADKQNELSAYSRQMAESICPVNDHGKFGYQHVIWGNEFFEKVQLKLKTIPGVSDNIFSPKHPGEDNLVNFAVNHHKPQTKLQAIITLADWWSAGMDRTQPEAMEKAELNSEKISWGKDRYKAIPLFSVFNTVNKGSCSNAFPLASLNIFKRDNIMPSVVTDKNDGISQEKYADLWKSFMQEFDMLPADSLKGFTESLLFLLKKFTWCIPSNTMDMANVSLYEHLKTTAAIADCIFEYQKDFPGAIEWNPTFKRVAVSSGEYPLIMVGGDISGIQKFIYNIASRKAAMSLKGRSFYLQLLIDSIIQRIISHDRINATLGHVIYSSGGKFYLLLPNTPKVKSALEEIRNETEALLWSEHKGKLIFNISWVPFSYAKNEVHYPQGEDKTLGGLWKALEDSMSDQKSTRFKNLMLKDFSSFFDVQSDGGKVKVCAVTGQNLGEGEYKIIDKQSETIVSNEVFDQITLGKILKDADFNITFKGKAEESSYLNKKAAFSKHVVNVANYLFDDKELTREDADFRTGISSADVSRVKMINQTNFLSAPVKGTKVSYGFQFYGGNKQALNLNNEYKTFEQLTETQPGNEKSETYFAVLRMDVDGLGNVFIKGLDNQNKSFSAFATMSFLLDMFFSGYINDIRNNRKSGEYYKYRDHVNILYSGGDDVFAVGRWDKIVEFAEELRDEFRLFVGREDISLSAGIAIVNNKFPIAKAAEIAGEAEKNAKKYKGETEKNAICFLGETISWHKEFPYVKKNKDEFTGLIKQHGMSKALLHRLINFAAARKDNEVKSRENKHFQANLSYIWHTAYYLKRFMERYKGNQEVEKFVKHIQAELFLPRNYDLIALAARWAELELKTDSLQ